MTRLLKVLSIRAATPTTRILRLSLGGMAFRYRAGQAALLGLADQDALVPYSIASAPQESQAHGWLEFLVKMEADGWGPHLAGVARGSRVTVRGPVGSFMFPSRPAEREFLFVAGGTGIAPLRSMIRDAFDRERPGSLRLLYSARTATEFAYLRELRQYAREGRLDLALTVTREAPVRWRGASGRITPAGLAPLVRTPRTLCFVCGPAAMVDDVPRMLTELGIARRRIRIEEW